MEQQTIRTKHPQGGKSGVNIDKHKYDVIRQAIMDTISAHEVISFKALTAEINEQLLDSFDGSIPWYVITVKLDLEARGVIERVAGSKPQMLRIVEDSG